MLNIVLFGSPGAGKGTQAEKIVAKYNLHHLSTGDMLRHQIATKTKLGIMAKHIINRGDLVPDEIVINMIKSELELRPDVEGFIFDGFPRSVGQAQTLDKLLQEIDDEITLMIDLRVEENEVITRLNERAKVSGREDDKDIEIIKNRIETYKMYTKPLQEYYSKQNKYIKVNGSGEIKEVTNKLFESINKYKK